MHERGHSEVPSFMYQATSMSPCPCFLSFWPISLHIPHFPQCHLTTLHRHHTPMRTMKWLVRTRGHLKVSSATPQDISWTTCSNLFCFWAISLPLHTHAHIHTHKYIHIYIYIFPYTYYIYIIYSHVHVTCSASYVHVPLPSSTWNVSFHNP